MRHGRLYLMLMLAALALWAAPGATRAEEDPLQEEVLSTNGETLAQSQAKAEAAAAQSKMGVTVSAVGFDIAAGSIEEKYLQATAKAGNGGYFTANDAGQLSAAMSAAASGQTGTAGTQGPVVLSAPREGDIVGPSMDILGKTTPGELVVLYTVPILVETGEKRPMVPGIRHRASATGDFQFRIATPRISFGETKQQVQYELHAYLLKADGTKSAETIVNVYSPKP